MNQKQEFTTKIQKYYEELEEKFISKIEIIIYNKKLKKQDIESKILKLGDKYEDLFYQKFPNISIHWTGRGGFKNDALTIINDLDEIKKRKKKKLKEKKEKIKDLITKSVCVDRAFNLINNDDLVIQFNDNFPYRVKWIHDVFFHKFYHWVESHNEKAKELTCGSDEINGIVKFKKARDIFFKELPEFSFTDKEFREITGLYHLTGEQIRDLAAQYSGIAIKKDIYFFDKGDYWESRKLIGTICTLDITETGRYSRRNKKPEHEYRFMWHAIGYLLFHNLLLGQFTIFDRKFYKLSRGAQEIYRKIAQHPSSKFKLETLCKIIGYKGKGLRTRKRLIKNCLSELEKEGFIRRFKYEGRGINTVYTIIRIFIAKKIKKESIS